MAIARVRSSVSRSRGSVDATARIVYSGRSRFGGTGTDITRRSSPPSSRSRSRALSSDERQAFSTRTRFVESVVAEIGTPELSSTIHESGPITHSRCTSSTMAASAESGYSSFSNAIARATDAASVVRRASRRRVLSCISQPSEPRATSARAITNVTVNAAARRRRSRLNRAGPACTGVDSGDIAGVDHVTHPPDGAHQRSVSGQVDLPAQTAHQHVDSVGDRVEVVIPDGFKDASPRTGAPCVSHEKLEQGELPGGQCERFTGALRRAQRRIEGEAVASKDRRDRGDGRRAKARNRASSSETANGLAR